MAEDTTQTINVVDPDTGEVGSIPVAQAQQALGLGYTQATEDQVDKQIRKTEFGTVPEQIKTGIEGAADALTFGLSTGAQTKLGISTPERIAARREENPLSRLAGQTAGLIGSAFIPGVGAANVAEKAGAGTAALVGLGEAAQATRAGRLGSAAVKAAVENALIQSGDEVSKSFLPGGPSDPNEAVQTALSNVGLAAGIGAIFGGATGGVKELFRAKSAPRIDAILQNTRNEAEFAGRNSSIDTAFDDLSRLEGEGGVSFDANSLGAPQTDQAKFLQNTIERRGTSARRTEEAFADFGLEPTKGSLTDDSILRHTESSLSKRPTIFGAKIGRERENVFNKLSEGLEKTLNDRTELSDAQVGRKIVADISSNISKEKDRLSSLYNSNTEYLKKIPIKQEQKDAFKAAILGHESATVIESESQRTAEKLARQIDSVKNAHDVKLLRSSVNRELSKAYRAGSEDLPVLQEGKNLLTSLRKSSIKNAEDVAGLEGTALGDVPSLEKINKIKNDDAAYAAFQRKIQDTAAASGVRGSNARSFIESLAKANPDKFADRIFKDSNANTLEFFEKNYPKEFDLAKRSYKKYIYEKATKTTQGDITPFNSSKFFNSFDSLSPEARAKLFSQTELNKIENGRIIYERLPKDKNPSGTAAEISINNLFSFQGALDNLSDATRYALLKNAPLVAKETGASEKASLIGLALHVINGKTPSAETFKATLNSIDDFIKGDNAANKAVKGLFKSTQELSPSFIIKQNDQSSRKKLDEKVVAMQQNPAAFLNANNDHLDADKAGALTNTIATAVSYLASLKPNEDRKSPLDPKPVVSQAERNIYNKALDIANNPLTVLNDVKNGTVNSRDIKTLQTIYPALYSKLSQKLVTEIMDHKNPQEIPYKLKTAISLFIGQPLDSTMKPASIVAAQNNITPKQQAQQQQLAEGPTGGTGGRRGSFKDLNKLASGDQTPGQARELARATS